MTVKILRPSLDDLGSITVLRGIVDRASLNELQFDYYQREKLPEASRKDIVIALETGAQLPDIELGMRGDKFQMEDNNAVVLLDPVFVIDGRQRTETLREFIEEFPECKARLGAIIHFNSNVKWERERFHILNASRTKVSPNVLLKNLKDDVRFVSTLYGLYATDREFALHNKISWRQNSGRSDHISATTYLRTTLRLHSHLAPTRQAFSVPAIVSAGVRLEERIGLPMLRANCKAFWDFVDQAWGIRTHEFKCGLPYLSTGFLDVLTRLLSDHVDFWEQPDNCKFRVSYELKQKFKKFNVYDPEILRLTGAHGAAREALYYLLFKHINSGKRSKRLIERTARPYSAIVEFPEEDENEAA